MDNIIEVKIDKKVELSDASDLYEARKIVSELSLVAKKYESEVTVWIQGYNKLEKTKRCVESVLKYTTDVDYELLLVDNGSTDGTFEYFKSIDHPKKTIVRINENIGTMYVYNVVQPNMISRYLVMLANDIIVTKNWLSNMLKVMKSDDKIGMVNPVSSNTSNMQYVNINYSTYDEMQEKAARYNCSDPAKWQERLRLITLGTLFRKECILACGWPLNDVGFFHDFADDDLTFSVRRAGYKAILATDTWICHDHKSTERDFEKMQNSLDAGRKNFLDKYHGIDAWDDVNNYIYNVLGNSIKNVQSNKATILGVDVKCGTPILDIKNIIREYGIYDAELSAFTRDAKYIEDLNTICDGKVVCDREEYLNRSFTYMYYDYIIIDKGINAYEQPFNVLADAYMLLKPGGQLIYSLHNTNTFYAFMKMLGYTVNKVSDEYYYDYPFDRMYADAEAMGMKVSFIAKGEEIYLGKKENDFIKSVVSTYGKKDMEEELFLRLTTERVWFSIEK